MTISTTPNEQKGNWTEQKSKLKTQFPILTDTDLHYENGKKDEMLGRIQAKIGKTAAEMTAIMEKL